MLLGAVQRERCDLRADLQVRGGSPEAELRPRGGVGWVLLTREGQGPAGREGLARRAALMRRAPSRSRTRCRHFLLAQLRDGRHVVLGEHSAHARLQDLLRHYTACPLGPYGETLTEPLVRQVRPDPGTLGPRPPEPPSHPGLRPSHRSVVKPCCIFTTTGTNGDWPGLCSGWN